MCHSSLAPIPGTDYVELFVKVKLFHRQDQVIQGSHDATEKYKKCRSVDWAPWVNKHTITINCDLEFHRCDAQKTSVQNPVTYYDQKCKVNMVITGLCREPWPCYKCTSQLKW